MKKFYAGIFLFLSTASRIFSQDYSLDSTRIHAQGNTGDFFLAALVVHNTTGNDITLHFTRITNNIPSGWGASCFCYPTCIAPWIDTLTFLIPAFGSDSIKPNFSSNSIPGIGFITIALHQQLGEGSFPDDTIYFSGSTLSTQIREINTKEINVYPNPVSDNLVAEFPNSSAVQQHLIIYNSMGEIVLKENFVGQKHSVNVSSLNTGIYLVKINANGAGTIRRQIVKE